MIRGSSAIVAAVVLVGGCRTPSGHLPEASRGEPAISLADVPTGMIHAQSEGDRSGASQAIHGSSIQAVSFHSQQSGEPGFGPEILTLPNEAEVLASSLTLTDLEAMALRNNPAVGQAAARVEAAQGNWVQVGLPPNPRVGYSGDEMGDDGTAGQQGGFVGQQFITGGKLRLSREAAAWQVQSAERELTAMRLRVLTDVRTAYYEVLIAQRRADLASELVRISVRGVEAAEALFRSAEVSEADPLRARVEADTARILFQTAINQRAEAWRRLTAVLGIPELQTQRLDGDLTPAGLELSWKQVLRRVLSESPEVAAAIADVEAARWAVERAYAEVVPDLNVQVGVAHNNANGDTLTGVNISLPLPIIDRNQGGIRSAQAEAAAAELAVDRLALDIQTRLAAAFQRYESARNQVIQYSKAGGILDNAARTLELIRIGYEAGEFDVIDFLTAQRTYFETNLAYLDSLRELWIAITEVRGLLLRDSLSQ
jgi:outer membrane protein, heavy metal efflux system